MKTQSSKELARRTLSLYWHHAWRYKGLVIGLIISVLAATLTFRYIPPLIVADVLQRLSNGDFTAGKLWESFGNDLLLYTGVAILGGIILWRVAIIFIWKLEMNVLRDMHRRIFDHLMNMSSTFHANRFGGSLVSQTNKFTGGYIRVADTTMFNVASLVMALIFSAIFLMPRAPYVVLFLFVFTILYIVIAIKITKKVRRLNAVEAATANKQTGFLADMITNIQAVKSYAGEAYENKRYAVANEATRSATRNVMRASVIRDSVFASATGILTVVSLALAIASVVLWNADIATVFLVVQYTGYISIMLWDFSQQALRNYNRALGDAEEMTKILAIEPSVKDAKNPEASHITNGAITLRDVTFAHPESNENEPLFQDFNLVIPAGKKIGLVGHSGSGKTTFTRLLLRFNDIDSGEILIDDQDIAHITQADLRRSIAYVPQEPMLFHRTLRENIAYGKPDASEDEILDAARKAHALEFIEKLPNGFDTLVGERGVKLSGGQRQRIAIARAMLKNAPILVLDEATSALDSESEVLIQAALWELMKGRTAIVIAHRLSTIQKMDQIIVLDNGKIAEEGSHKELVAKKNGTYAKLWAHQSGGFIEE
ncbi:MAG: ABC transporter ATP-binding protein [Candidatus Saccharimonadales bacterium]